MKAVGLLIVLVGLFLVDATGFLSSKRKRVFDYLENVEGLHASPTAYYYSQTLDHFDAENTQRWAQRYYVNDSFFTDPVHGPVFLYIEGEGAARASDVLVGHHMEMAQLYGALVIAVEHRYYGASVPTPDLSTPNMKWLSSHQALADLAEFYGFAQQQFKLTKKNPWFSFGGSYPGALSAWFRLKFPHLVYGSIASSGPVRAQFNFQDYNNVVADSLSAPIVGGSQACLSSVTNSFSALSQLTVNELQTKFMSCLPLSDPKDVFMLVANLADIFEEIVQYNTRSNPNISDICQIMTDPSRTPLESLILVNSNNLAKINAACMDNSYALSIKRDFGNITVDRSATGVGIRQWTWQTCTEFAYFQTCDPGTRCPFSPLVDIASQTDYCVELFGINPNAVSSKVDFSNLYYGSDQPDGSRIVFVNGSIDPWHALSVLSDLTNNQTAVFIPGTSHCADMGSTKPNDPQPLTDARQLISNTLGDWIYQARMGSSV